MRESIPQYQMWREREETGGIKLEHFPRKWICQFHSNGIFHNWKIDDSSQSIHADYLLANSLVRGTHILITNFISVLSLMDLRTLCTEEKYGCVGRCVVDRHHFRCNSTHGHLFALSKQHVTCSATCYLTVGSTKQRNMYPVFVPIRNQLSLMVR